MFWLISQCTNKVKMKLNKCMTFWIHWEPSVCELLQFAFFTNHARLKVAGATSPPPNVKIIMACTMTQAATIEGFPKTKWNMGIWWGGQGSVSAGLLFVLCFVIQFNQSLCFCSLEHIPWTPLRFVPYNLHNTAFESCREKWGWMASITAKNTIWQTTCMYQSVCISP